MCGTASTGAGVSGTSTGYNGVNGITSFNATSSAVAGVAGYSTTSSRSGYGVYGESFGGGLGVDGVSQSGYGIEGYTPGAYSVGVAGIAPSSIGVSGEGEYGLEAIGEGTGTKSAILGYSFAGGYLLWLQSEAAGSPYCTVDGVADLYCTGSITSGQAARTRHVTAGGQHVAAFADESTSQTIEDMGEARLYDGVVNVLLSSDFASVIDRSASYLVFLTPQGDTRGIYVSAKTSAGFQVRNRARPVEPHVRLSRRGKAPRRIERSFTARSFAPAASAASHQPVADGSAAPISVATGRERAGVRFDAGAYRADLRHAAHRPSNVTRSLSIWSPWSRASALIVRAGIAYSTSSISPHLRQRKCAWCGPTGS